MGEIIIFEPYRDVAFKSILSTAFKSFPKRVEQILSREGWNHFKDFMAAVERSGRVLFQFGEAKWDQKAIEEHGHENALKLMYNVVNTNAMKQLLSEAFFGEQEGEVDRSLAAAALFPLGITTWHTFSMAVLELALLDFAEATGGQTPMDVAKPDTLLFHGLTSSESPEVMYKVMKAFGFSTPQQRDALSSAFWSGDLTMEDLDQAVGNPELLTEMVNRCPSNPYKGIVFSAVDNPL